MSRIEEVLISLRRIIRAVDLYSKHLGKTTGLTAPQILLLQAIQSQHRSTVGELANKISLSQATVTVILDRLEKRHLIVRERSQEDKRKVRVSLTDQAVSLLKKAPIPLQEHFADQFTNLRGWEQTLIVSALQRVAYMMDAADIDASPVLDIGTLDRQDNTDV